MSLEGTRRQKAMQMDLQLENRGEALRGERSGEASTAANGTGRSGADGLMERVVERGHVTGVPRLAASPQPTEPPDADPHVRWCGRGLAGEPLTPIPIQGTCIDDSRGECLVWSLEFSCSPDASMQNGLSDGWCNV